jgi:hypothetical protein
MILFRRFVSSKCDGANRNGANCGDRSERRGREADEVVPHRETAFFVLIRKRGRDSKRQQDCKREVLHDLILFKSMRSSSINSSMRFESQRMNQFEHGWSKYSTDHFWSKVTFFGP